MPPVTPSDETSTPTRVEDTPYQSELTIPKSWRISTTPTTAAKVTAHKAPRLVVAPTDLPEALPYTGPIGDPTTIAAGAILLASIGGGIITASRNRKEEKR